MRKQCHTAPCPNMRLATPDCQPKPTVNVRGQEAALIFCLLSISNLLFIIEKPKRNQVKGGSKTTKGFANLTRAGGWVHIPTRLMFLNGNRDVSGQTEH